MTNTFSATDRVVKKRKRPGGTTPAAKRARKDYFGAAISKDIAIPVVVDAYNYAMNGADTKNQLRSSFSVSGRHIKWNKALFDWILDMAIIHAYMIWRQRRQYNDRSHDLRRAFNKQLIQSMLTGDQAHEQRQYYAPRRCTDISCQPAALAIHNRIVGKRTRQYCMDCNIVLCNEHGCWESYHTDPQAKLP